METLRAKLSSADIIIHILGSGIFHPIIRSLSDITFGLISIAVNWNWVDNLDRTGMIEGKQGRPAACYSCQSR